MSGSTDRPYITSGEAARLLGVSRQTVLRWAHSGALPWAQTIGGHLRFRPADVRSLSRDLGGDLASASPPQADRPSWQHPSAHEGPDSPESLRSGV